MLIDHVVENEFVWKMCIITFILELTISSNSSLSSFGTLSIISRMDLPILLSPFTSPDYKV